MVSPKAALEEGLLLRVWSRSREIDIMGLSASVAFYVVLGVFPGLAAVVALFSLVGDPGAVPDFIRSIESFLPDGSIGLLEGQARRASRIGRDATGMAGPLFGFALLLWSANYGMRGLFRGLNDIYRQEEKRGVFAFAATTFLFTVAGIAFLVCSLGVVVVLPRLVDAIGLSSGMATIAKLARWPVLLAFVVITLMFIYRFGPSRTKVSWRSAAIGSLAASLLWVCVSAIFSWYSADSDRFASLYGPLAAAAAFMIWVWLSMATVLLGAVLDSALARE